MADETILCAGCGITLRPFMRVCSRCGLERADAAPIWQAEPLGEQNAAGTTAPSERAGQTIKTNLVPFEAVRQQRAAEEVREIPSDMVFMSPNETKRRFPLFTAAQKVMIAIGAGLLLLLLVVAYLLWQQHQQDTQRNAAAAAQAAQPAATIPPGVLPTPTPTPDGAAGDAALTEAVRLALSAYNPLGFSRYQFEVKEGVVTVNGEAEHQPEKDGVDNVVKLIAGVKSVVNNLKVKSGLPPTFGAGAPGVFNTAEAKLLDEAMRRQAQANEASAEPTPDPQQREAERQRRELAAAKLREEELAMRKAAEEKLRLDAEERERKQEEIRRAADAERRARAEQARLEASVLRSGTVAWSGLVDGVDEIIIAGNSASVRHIDGQPAREVRASFSAPLPRSPVNVRVISSNGRGAISIIQQPAAANGYTTIVRVDDSGKGGEKLHQFTLRWSAQ